MLRGSNFVGAAFSGRALEGLVITGLSVLTLGCGAEPGADSDARAFIERLGADTMSVEVFARTPTGFEGDVLVRSPVTRVAHYEATLADDGTVERMHVRWTTPPENPDGPPPAEMTVTVEGDSATIELVGGQNPGTSKMAVPASVIPTVGKNPQAFAVFEQAVMQARASGADRYPVAFLSAGRGRVQENAIVQMGPDSVSIDFFGNPIVAKVDASGYVLGRSGERTTLKLVGEPAAGLDFQTLAADFAARDARGEGLGVASPQATVETTIGGANLRVVYSRPAMRGRDIWGGLVPFGEVWRTGANAATEFSTDRDLDIGDVRVPAGTYTLFSQFTAESAHLIINRQTGQWGTAYDQARDLARVELAEESLTTPVERFTIAIEPAAEGASLQLIWDTTRYTVPIRVR
ncbi:MAG: DUF2911 domain-containing protein [Gemmatimonadales bacterium]|jgi:hypothetical protein